MKKKLTNPRVINSIGIGILAAITAGMPVVAALNDSLSEDNAAEPVASEPPEASVEMAAASQNGEIIDTISEAQATIQGVRDELNQISGENVDNPEVTGGDNGAPSEGGDITDISQTPVEPGTPSEGTGSADGSQPSGDGEAQPGITEGGQISPDGVGPEGSSDPAAFPDAPLEEDGYEENTAPPIVDTPPDSDGTETDSATIDEYLANTQDALDNIKNDEDVRELEKKNQDAQAAIDHLNEAVDNPNNFIGSVVEIISDASNAVVDSVASVTADEKVAKDQAQAAVDAQAKLYENREAAEAAQQQAAAAAAAADEAYRSAQATVEEAENQKAVADERLTDLERQLEEADAALRDMEIKVQDAQEALLAVLEKYGLEEGVNPEDLQGDARAAYENAQAAVGAAAEELKNAQAEYGAISEQVKEATDSYADAVEALDQSHQNMQDAISHLEKKKEEWNTAKVDEKIEKYNVDFVATQQVYIRVENAEDVLKAAKEALNSAQTAKDKADEVRKNAEDAYEAAKNKEAETAEEAAEAALEAENASKQDAAEAKEAAEAAAELAREAAEQVQRDLVCLNAAGKDAEQAQIDLDAARAAVGQATTDRDEAQELYNQLLAEWDQSKEEAIEAQIQIVDDCLEKYKGDTANGTEKYEMAYNLLKFKLLSDGKDFSEIKAGDSSKNEIIVVDSNGVQTVYCFYAKSSGMGLYQKNSGTTTYIDKSIFENDKAEFKKEKSNLQSTADKVSQLEGVLADAEKAENKADLICILLSMKDEFTAVQKEAEDLVAKETPLGNDNEGSLLDQLSVSLNRLISGGKTYQEAEQTLQNVKAANGAVQDALQKLADYSVQDDWNQEEYDRLKAAYNTAKADCDVATEALEKCVEGLNSARTEKNRARIAASAIFEYISTGDVRPVTPTEPTSPTNPSQPGATGPTTSTQPVTPVEPVYGTVIDNVTTPTTADRGVSSGAGNTGYTYTAWGGQTAYTAPAAEVPESEPEEEPAEEELVNVEDEAVPLAQIDADNKKETNSTKTTRKVDYEKVPLANTKTEKSKFSWWWILVIALLGATGTELYMRHRDKEEEKKAKSKEQALVKI